MASADESLFQSEELLRAVVVQDDFDLAYRLQLQEAMEASSHPAKIVFQEAKQEAESARVCSSPPYDGALALALQNEELFWSQKREQDRSLIASKSEQVQLDIKQRVHDAAFAQSLMDMDDHEWEAGGDLVQNPFTPHSASCAAQPTLFCKLYMTVASSENDTLFAMGAVILDSRNVVLTELKKSLEPGTSKACADYMALLTGLQTIHAMGFQHIEAHTDSVLLYNQITNRWRVRNDEVLALWSQLMEYVYNLPAFHMFLEPRNLNQHATRLAREAVSGIRIEGAVSQGSKSCSICLELKPGVQMVKVLGCSHEFCSTCINQHAEVKIQAGQVPVNCPHFSCTTMFCLDQCQSILSQRWFDLLRKRLVEASIPEGERVYCPYLRCSALMDRRHLNDANVAPAASSSNGGATRKMCVECARFFCVECRVPWHSSMSCSYYQKLPPELRDAQDAKLHQLAENQKWQRCKKCRRMIELSEGCYHMTCRCGYEFCYVCGKEWKDKAATCECRLWDEAYLLRQQQAPLVNNEVANGFDADLDVDMEFDEVDGRSNFLFVSNPAHPYYKTKLCRHWAGRGVCFAGDHCNFAHGAHELRQSY